MKTALRRFFQFGILPALVIVVADTVFGLNSYGNKTAQQNLLIVCVAMGTASIFLVPLAIRAIRWGDTLFKTEK
jgi:hypothetical protein